MGSRAMGLRCPASLAPCLRPLSLLFAKEKEGFQYIYGISAECPQFLCKYPTRNPGQGCLLGKSERPGYNLTRVFTDLPKLGPRLKFPLGYRPGASGPTVSSLDG
eukprot:6457649-Amphidinium_carterae.4